MSIELAGFIIAALAVFFGIGQGIRAEIRAKKAEHDALEAIEITRQFKAQSSLSEQYIVEAKLDALSLSIDEKMLNDPRLWKVYDSPPQVIDISHLDTSKGADKLRLQSFALFVLGIFNVVFSYIHDRETKGLEVSPTYRDAWYAFMKEFVEGSTIARELLHDNTIKESFESHFREKIKQLIDS